MLDRETVGLLATAINRLADILPRLVNATQPVEDALETPSTTPPLPEWATQPASHWLTLIARSYGYSGDADHMDTGSVTAQLRGKDDRPKFRALRDWHTSLECPWGRDYGQPHSLPGCRKLTAWLARDWRGGTLDGRTVTRYHAVLVGAITSEDCVKALVDGRD